MSLFHHSTTVHPGTRLVEYRNGVFSRVLEPGKHRRPRHARYDLVAVRTQLNALGVQEIPTSDGLTVRVSASVRWAVVDPRRFVEVAAVPFDVVYLAVQIALREALVDVEAIDAAKHLRVSAQSAVVAAARASGTEVGIEVQDVVVKDVLLPAELRAAQAELATARTRGLAELEKARSETAALRSLANAAKMLDDHPALAQLRLVQALPHGTQFRLSVSGD